MFKKNSATPAEQGLQENRALQKDAKDPDTLAQRLKTVIRQKATAISPIFKSATETPILELDSISRPSRAQERMGAWKQPDENFVAKTFGAKAEKYVLWDDVQPTKKDVKTDFENSLKNANDDLVDQNIAEIGENSC